MDMMQYLISCVQAFDNEVSGEVQTTNYIDFGRSHSLHNICTK